MPGKYDLAGKHIAVIGAGVSGLVSIKEVLELNNTVVAFESASSIGGVYATHYDSLTMTSSSATTRFGSRSNVNDAKPGFWTRDQYLDYLEDYATRYKLRKHIRFGHRVISVTRNAEDAKWVVRWREDGGPNGEETEEFDAVAICCGVHAKSRVPDLQGLDKFSGVIQHSSDFTGHEDLSAETVLVIGLGESGSDIALMAAKKARKVILSTRRGPGYLISRMTGGIPSDVDTSRAYHSFPIVRYNNLALRLKRLLDRIYQSPQIDDPAVRSYIGSVNARRGLSAFQRFGTKNSSYVESVLYHGATEKPATIDFEGRLARFADGSNTHVDRIVFCTGYKPEFPEFLPNSLDMGDSFDPRALYKRMFIPSIGPDLAFIGFVRPGIGSIPPMVEMQARYFALVVSGLRSLPKPSAMQADIEDRKRRDHLRYLEDAETTRSLTDYLSYMDNMADAIGCRPSLLGLLLTEPLTWYKVMFGPINGLQYRLHGPGADPACARSSLHATRTVGRVIVAYEAAILLLCAPLRLMFSLLHFIF